MSSCVAFVYERIRKHEILPPPPFLLGFFWRLVRQIGKGGGAPFSESFWICSLVRHLSVDDQCFCATCVSSCAPNQGDRTIIETHLVFARVTKEILSQGGEKKSCLGKFRTLLSNCKNELPRQKFNLGVKGMCLVTRRKIYSVFWWDKSVVDKLSLYYTTSKKQHGLYLTKPSLEIIFFTE